MARKKDKRITENKEKWEGRKFNLNCGVTVTLVQYNGWQDVVVEDNFGNRKNALLSQVVKKSMIWPWEVEGNNYVSFAVGSKFELECGVIVTVVAYNSCNNIVVQDSQFNQKKTSSFCLKKGDVNWSKFGAFGRCSYKREYCVGSKWESRKSGWFEILEVVNSLEATVLWENTGYVQRNCHISSIRNRSLTDKSVANLTPKGHYVYIVAYEGKVVYVGKGEKNRLRHVNSGKSCNRELNRHYFKNEKLDVFVYKEEMNSQEAQKLEAEIISAIKPPYNIAGVN